MNIKLQLPKVTDLRPRLVVVGVGGAGGNAVNNMIASGLEGVQFVVANTDAQALSTSSAEHRLQLGVNLTEGLGAGSKPEIGEAAAEEAIDEIKGQLSGAHMVFVAAGMGGGTGTGAASVIARVARELGILTVGVVTKPFHFEGSRRQRIAEAGIAELRKYVDTLIVIPNQNLFRIANDRTTFSEAFVMADQVLYSGIACIVDLIVKEGLINLDFADVRTVMTGMGTAMMGTGEASGEGRAIAAAEDAISNPLLDDITLRGARGLLVSIIGGRDLTLYEVDAAASRVRQEVDPEANIIVGATFDESLGDRIRVSIVASGMSQTAIAAPAAHGHGRPDPSRMRDAGPFVSNLGISGPPPVPYDTAYGRSTGNGDDLTRALSEAIDRAAAAQPDQPAGGAIGRAAKSFWNAGDGVTFEDAAPHVGVAPGQRDPSWQPPRDADQFSPSAPMDVRRVGRRMPQVEDFPAVAQREYHAKKGGQSFPEQGYAPAPTAARRISFFERLTGSRKKEADDGRRASSQGHLAESDRAGRTPDSASRGTEQSASRGSARDNGQGTPDSEFLGGGRKR